MFVQFLVLGTFAVVSFSTVSCIPLMTSFHEGENSIKATIQICQTALEA